MKIDCFIMNPPYAGQGKLANIHQKIIKMIKDKKPTSLISVNPMNSCMKYKSAEFIKGAFDIKWNNVFIFDCLGNNNEYFIESGFPYWNKKGDKSIWIVKHKVDIVDNKITTMRRRTAFDNKYIDIVKPFIKWLNENKLEDIQKCSTTLVSPKLYNYLWEIYENE